MSYYKVKLYEYSAYCQHSPKCKGHADWSECTHPVQLGKSCPDAVATRAETFSQVKCVYLSVTLTVILVNTKFLLGMLGMRVPAATSPNRCFLVTCEAKKYGKECY